MPSRAGLELEALSGADREAALAGLDIEAVGQRRSVPVFDTDGLAVDAVEPDVPAAELEDEQSFGADLMLEGRRGAAHRALLPSERMAWAASSALISRRASRSRMSSRVWPGSPAGAASSSERGPKPSERTSASTRERTVG